MFLYQKRNDPCSGASHENIMFLTAPFGFLALGANDIQNLIQPLHLSALLFNPSQNPMRESIKRRSRDIKYKNRNNRRNNRITENLMEGQRTEH